MLKRLCLITLLFSHLGMMAQSNCDLHMYGKVLDEHDQSYLSFASIQMLSSSFGVSADDSGSYRLDNLCADTYYIVVTHIGCKPDTFEVRLDSSMEYNFTLEHHWEELETVEIDGMRTEYSNKPGETISEEVLQENSGKPLAELLEQVNGVSSMNTGSNISKPVIQGFSSNRVQILNHGVQHIGQQWGDEHAPELDPFAEANYTVLKGASALRYGGGALGGFVLVEPKPLPQEVGIGGNFQSLFATNNRMGTASLMLEGKLAALKNFSWRAQSSYKRGGNIRTPNYYQKNSGVEERNHSFSVGYLKDQLKVDLYYSLFTSQVGIFSGAHIGNLTDLQNAINRSEPREIDQEGFSYDIRRPRQRIVHELVRLKVDKYINSTDKISFTFSRQFNIREEFDKERPRNQTIAALDIPEFSVSLESYVAELSVSISDEQEGNFDFGLSVNLLDNSLNSIIDFIPDYKGSQLSGFVLWDKQYKKVELDAGVRFDIVNLGVQKLRLNDVEENDFVFSQTSANTGINYSISEKSKLGLVLTYAERAPAINELYSEGLHHGTATLEFGDTSLNVEKSHGINTSYTSEFGKLNVQADAFYQYIDDFIYLDPQGLDLTIRGAYPSFKWSNTRAQMLGLDVSLDYQLTKMLNLQSSWSFIQATDLSDNSYLVMIPANRSSHSISYKRGLANGKHLLKMELNYQYVFKQTRFDEAEEISEPPEAYGLAGANLSFSTQIKKVKTRIGLQLNNALNQVYRDYLNRFRFYTDEQGRDLQLRLSCKF